MGTAANNMPRLNNYIGGRGPRSRRPARGRSHRSDCTTLRGPLSGSMSLPCRRLLPRPGCPRGRGTSCLLRSRGFPVLPCLLALAPWGCVHKPHCRQSNQYVYILTKIGDKLCSYRVVRMYGSVCSMALGYLSCKWGLCGGYAVTPMTRV